MTKKKYASISVETLQKELQEKIPVSIQNIHKASNKKIYFAGPWFTKKAELVYQACLDTYACLIRANKIKYNIYWPKLHTNTENAKATYYDNILQIEAADIVVALVNEKDTGTAFEIGYALAKGKDVYLLGYNEDCFKSKTNIMLAFSGKCFTIDKLAKFLTDNMTSDDYIKVSNSWEGKE